MKLTKIEQVNEFLSIDDSCKGDVILRSLEDVYKRQGGYMLAPSLHE